MGVARMLYADSIYTESLRRKGLRLGGPADLTILRRLVVEQVALEPAVTVQSGEPFQKIIDLMAAGGRADFIVVGTDSRYRGMIPADDVTFVLLQPEAIPLLTCGDLARADLAAIKSSDDLATALETFARHDVARLPVVVAASPEHVVGLVSRAALMRRYQQELAGKG
jgi:CIC family chloride channel protein